MVVSENHWGGGGGHGQKTAFEPYMSQYNRFFLASAEEKRKKSREGVVVAGSPTAASAIEQHSQKEVFSL